MDAYDCYGIVVEQLASPIVTSGRYSFQSEGVPLIVQDILAKLCPRRTDRLLEVGCNVGLLLSPLAQHVKEAVGLDHPAVLQRYRELGVPPNVRLCPGKWPETRPDGAFDRILIYSVIQCLPDERTAKCFVRECLPLLRPGGRLLIGDVANVDRKRRFLESEYGKRFHHQWSALKTQIGPEDTLLSTTMSNMPPSCGAFLTDRFLTDLLTEVRTLGFEAYLLPQPSELPFGHSREDVLVTRWG